MCMFFQTNVDDNIQLGPGGKFGGWGRGSTGGGKNASQEKERPSTPGNRFVGQYYVKIVKKIL